MKRLFLFIFLAWLSINAPCQDVSGSWYGSISIMGQSLRINFHISQKDGQYAATMDSPDQKAFGLPMKTAQYQNQELKLSLMNITYTATLDSAGNLDGIFKQAGFTSELYMRHEPVADTLLTTELKPQEPRPPFPYQAEEVRFKGGGDYELAGTLIRPKKGKNRPVAVFISGSGGQNRDEELFGHKPFLVIADYLARRGIASLRYDDRGMGESGGHQNLGSSIDNAKDAAAAVAFLKDSGFGKIGLIGHSEGGLIAPMVAAQDQSIAFIVSLAGTGVSGADILKKQNRDLAQAEEISEASWTVIDDLLDRTASLSHNHPDSVRCIIEESLQKLSPEQLDIVLNGMSQEDYMQMSLQQMSNEWMFFFIRHDPRENWEQVNCPVLALNGRKDLQVNADINLAAIQQALKEGKNPKLTIIQYPDLNHLFQTAVTGALSEYAEIAETIAPVVLKDITRFIRKSTRMNKKMIRTIDASLAVFMLIMLYLLLKRKNKK